MWMRLYYRCFWLRGIDRYESTPGSCRVAWRRTLPAGRALTGPTDLDSCTGGFMRMEHRVRSRPAGRLGILDERKVERPIEDLSRAARDMALDINTAISSRLKSLTGIGEHYAQRIIAGRPYRSREELLTRQILPNYIYGRIMERFCVTQSRE